MTKKTHLTDLEYGLFYDEEIDGKLQKVNIKFFFESEAPLSEKEFKRIRKEVYLLSSIGWDQWVKYKDHQNQIKEAREAVKQMMREAP